MAFLSGFGASLGFSNSADQGIPVDVEQPPIQEPQGQLKAAGRSASSDQLDDPYTITLSNAPPPAAAETDDFVLDKLRPDVRLYETSEELRARLGERRGWLDNKDPTRKDRTDCVRLEDVKGEMDELRTDKAGTGDSMELDLRKLLEAACKNTVIPRHGQDEKKLDAIRICQIENRLKHDPSLAIPIGPNGLPKYEFPDNPSASVKRSLIRTYLKIRKSGHDMSAVTQHQLDERVSVLKRLSQ
eukprot:TRINITY_DN99917_c0_g1_i1.p1 TRINITY_DN99917_c0_g1~~TRINITY_DN99917_c0_g1_i1.p1  ORF type:complete len:243 (-),score=47.80 TRINITY_DN99917_c0_g1_i1:104-832(-)